MTFFAAPRSFRYLLGGLVTITLAALVTGLTWYATEHVIGQQRRETIERNSTIVSGLATTYTEQISRQILALDQTLDIMVKEWETNPRSFNLEAWRSRSTVLTGISRDMFLTDENGVIRQSSVPEFIGQSAAELDVFQNSLERVNEPPKLYLGAASINPIMRQWHLDAARTLRRPDGSFAGIIDADYRLSSITNVFDAASPGVNGFAALINLTDGKLRATHGPATDSPDASVADTPLFAAVDAAESGLWTGPSTSDAAIRLHAFRRVAGHELAVAVGLDQQEILRPVRTWANQARMFAAAITGLAGLTSLVILFSLYNARRRALVERESQAKFATANALAEVERAHADIASRQLQATFDAVHDGIAIFDAHLNLVEWNPLFPDRTGVNASFIRTGLPMEDLLRLQAEAGCFGDVADVRAEVERRTALLRAGNFGDSQRFQADGRVVELHCQPLAEGGFIALCIDVTDAKRAREALQGAAAGLIRERSGRLRFLEVISYELRERVEAVLQSVARLRSTALSPEQSRALDRARLAGDRLAGLATDAVEVPRMEAGTLVLHPGMIALRPLLQDIVDTFQPAAADQGIAVYLIVGETTPPELIVDGDRIRQVLALLLTESLRYAAPNAMWLIAEPSAAEDAGAAPFHLTIRAFGAQISDEQRGTMFPALNAVAVPTGETGKGTGLGAAIAAFLTRLMGGGLLCTPWATPDGRTGNDFVMVLPPGLNPHLSLQRPADQTVHAEGGTTAATPASRPLPRTRVLMVGTPSGLQVAAATMLRREGHMVDTVPSGAAAVRAINRAPYDIVFMDTVLPDLPMTMASRYIRHLPGPARTVPIIALAGAYTSAEEDGWRAAGIDEVSSNAPSLPALTDVIGRHVWLGGTSELTASVPAEWRAEGEDGIPLLSIDRIRELRANIPHEQLIDMVEECITDLNHRLPTLRRALNAKTHLAISAQAHAMVGMAGGYGMSVLEARLRAIMSAVREDRLDTIDGAADMVEADLTRATAALRQAVGSNLPAQ